MTFPIAAGVIPAAANRASVLVESGLRPHVVVMSMGTSSHHSPSILGRAQAVAEEILTWAGLNPTILRVAALFHENVLLPGYFSREPAVLTSSFGAGRVPWIGGRDAAELAVRELIRPAPSSAAVTYPPGAEVLSHDEIAKVISAETGRNSEYLPVSQQEWQRILEGQVESGKPSPVNRAMAQHISVIGAGFANGKAPLVQPDPDALTATLGHRPATFVDFVREHRSEFTDFAH